MANNNTGVPILKSRKDFEKLRSEGRIVKINPWLIVSYRKNEIGRLRVGWTISSYTGSAVIRNRLKRWLREYLRQQRAASLRQEFDVNLIFTNRSLDRKKNRVEERTKTKNKVARGAKKFFSELKHEEVNAALDRIFFQLLKKE